jgi:kynureninase
VVARAGAEALDRADPLASFRDRFVFADDTISLSGDSLGRLPKATVERLEQVVQREWGAGLVRGWDRWLDLPRRVGDLIGTALLGAAPGETVVCDSTTVNLHKLAAAALATTPHRPVIVTDAGNFPTDRYVLESLGPVRWVDRPGTDGLADDVGLVSFAHVDYRTGAVADLPGITAAVHRAGARVLWDLSHSAGVLPIGLAAHGVDLAVGCTYKYLCGGPGSPAFAYVRHDLVRALRSPIRGWFGQRDQFAMGPRYEPADDVRRFLAGTPPVLALVAAEEGARVAAAAGVEDLAEKAAGLTSFALALFDAWLAPEGFGLASPRDASRRGAHLAVTHPRAETLTTALLGAGVLTDFRAPDILRLGLAPLSTRYVDVWDALDRLRTVCADLSRPAEEAQPGR